MLRKIHFLRKSALQLSSAFSDMLPAQLSKSFPQLSSAFFSKFATPNAGSSTAAARILVKTRVRVTNAPVRKE